MSRKSNIQICITPAAEAASKPFTAAFAEKIGFSILSFFILFLLLTAIGSAFNSICNLGLSNSDFRFACLFTSLWGFLVYLNKKWAPVLFLAGLLVFCGYCYQNRMPLLNGGENFLNHIFFNINHYYQVNIELFQGPMSRAALSTFVSALIFLLGAPLSFGLLGKIHPSIPILFSAIIILGGLMFGQLPEENTLLLFFFCCFLIISINKWQKPYSLYDSGISLWSGIITGTVFFLCLFLSIYFIAPKYSMGLRSYNKTLLETATKLEQKIVSGELYYEIFYSGRFSLFQSSPGVLSNQTPQHTNTDVLKVSAAGLPEGSLYLKGWAGSDYNGRGWDPIDDNVFYNASKDWPHPGDVESYGSFYPEDLGFLVQNLGYYFLSMGQTFPENYMEVTSLQKDNLVLYAPYFCKYDSPLNPTTNTFTKSDGYIFSDKSDSYGFHGYPFYSFTKRKNLKESRRLPAEVLQIQEHYLDYINQEYRELPNEGLTALKELCKNQELSDIDKITNFIASFLHSQTIYSTSLSPLPLNEDFVDYFLFQQKKGFCTHFASSATLMYRMFGIPARYVSGYLVRQSDFKKISDHHYEALVPDWNSHAWTEIYIESEGWVPVDLTPGYSDIITNLSDDTSNSANVQIPDFISENNTPKPEMENPETIPETSAADSSEETPVGFLAKILSIPPGLRNIIFLLTGSILLFLLLCLRRFILLYKRKILFQKRDYNQILQNLSINLYAMIKTAGYVKRSYKNDNDYCEDMCKKLAVLAPNSLSRYKDFAKFVELSQKCFFSKEPIHYEEFILSQQVYQRVHSLLSAEQTGIKKFYWKYIRCFL